MGYKGSLKDKWIRELGEEKGLERWKVYKEKLSNRPYTNEHRKKLSEAKKGKKFTEEHKKRLLENSGTRGRSLHSIWTEKYGKEEADKKLDDFKKTMSKATSGKNNPKYGKKYPGTGNHNSLYDCWLKKYGEDAAKDKLEKYRKTMSKATSGKNNGMYGRSPSKEAGNGYAGHYKNTYYFRSLLELSYLIIEIEGKNIKWESGEKKKYSMPYVDLNGEERTYKPDFCIIEENKIIEIKPERLQGLKDNIHKFEKAKKFYEGIGYTYRVVDPPYVHYSVFENLYLKGDIIFGKRNEDRFKQFLERLKNRERTENERN